MVMGRKLRQMNAELKKKYTQRHRNKLLHGNEEALPSLSRENTHEGLLLIYFLLVLLFYLVVYRGRQMAPRSHPLISAVVPFGDHTAACPQTPVFFCTGARAATSGSISVVASMF
jgi:hypothetical protein